MGYDTLHIGEHPSAFALAPIAAMMAAAGVHDQASDRHSDLHQRLPSSGHPGAGGRYARSSFGRASQLGIGAGWFLGDYTSTGMSFDAPAVRVGGLEEAVLLIKQLFAADPVTFSGNRYAVQDLNLRPKPLQSPHPPIFVGGGGKRLLSFAAREANIVSVIGKATRHGTMDIATREIDSFEQKLGWIRDAAGERFDTLELHTLVQEVVVTDDRRQSAEELIRWSTTSLPASGIILPTPPRRSSIRLCSSSALWNKSSTICGYAVNVSESPT